MEEIIYDSLVKSSFQIAKTSDLRAYEENLDVPNDVMQNITNELVLLSDAELENDFDEVEDDIILDTTIGSTLCCIACTDRCLCSRV